MKDINTVVLTGRITKDPELKYTSGGTAIMSFSLAVNYSKKQGEQWVDEVSFFDCNYFGKAAESVKQYMTKGQMVAIEGELRQERWEKDGLARSKVVINVANLRLVGGQKAENSTPVYNAYNPNDDIKF